MKRIKLELTEDQQKQLIRERESIVSDLDWETKKMAKTLFEPEMLKGRHNQARTLDWYKERLPKAEKELAFNVRLLEALKAKNI